MREKRICLRVPKASWINHAASNGEGARDAFANFASIDCISSSPVSLVDPPDPPDRIALCLPRASVREGHAGEVWTSSSNVTRAAPTKTYCRNAARARARNPTVNPSWCDVICYARGVNGLRSPRFGAE